MSTEIGCASRGSKGPSVLGSERHNVRGRLGRGMRLNWDFRSDPVRPRKITKLAITANEANVAMVKNKARFRGFEKVILASDVGATLELKGTTHVPRVPLMIFLLELELLLNIQGSAAQKVSKLPEWWEPLTAG